MADNVEADMNEMGSDPDSSDDGLDYQTEAENLVEGSQWWNPPEGRSEVTFLNDGRETTSEMPDGDVVDQVVFEIDVDGEERLWSVTKAQSKVSLYGQLVQVGAAYEGLEGETIHLIRQGEGSDTTYTVEEAADL